MALLLGVMYHSSMRSAARQADDAHCKPGWLLARMSWIIGLGLISPMVSA